MAEREAIVSPDVAMPVKDIFPHAVKAAGLVFVSGSIGMDKDGSIVPGGIQERTHQVIQNFKNVLEAAGSSLDKIVKLNVFIADMNDFSAMNEAYKQHFKAPNLPCRTCVAVKTLPFNTDVEMECTALA
ncbi:Endoribonuclease L-PSP/chorismate mutase-like protein [Neohortaea acidophila]|uniref:Endoribonuclease L-PSP/chorismate mutase-like protein n=1 Tax=Neohortaea acidophila TaxID=245834 RepID=A0A6A6PGG1_9PEZI|nr:Endoribonuclease L-PSP/chorismate mutase-like protein [Neohortaea acidophila]KAF2479062.1 Endoribonuclease L-PSP/chorismate mutase-like protein [Neohortaea acidophila]